MRALLAALVLLAGPAWAQQPVRRAPAPPPAAAPERPAAPAEPEKPHGLAVDSVVPLKGPGGPWGTPVVDEQSRRLYLPRGPAGVVVLSLEGFKPLGEVPDTAGSGVLALDGETLRGFSADTLAEGGGTAVVAFDVRALKPVGKVAVEKPQHMVFDVATRQLVVLGAEGTLSLVDPVKLAVTGTVALEGRRFAGLSIDRRGRAFVVQADRESVAVVDLVARRVATSWPIAPCRNPVSALFEPSNFRLVLACRGAAPGPAGAAGAPGTPGVEAMGVVLDGHSGRAVSNLPVPSQVEAIVSDSGRRVLYVTSALGSLMALRQVDFNRYQPVEIAATRPAAAVGVVDGRTGRLILPWADYTVPLAGLPEGKAPQRRYAAGGGALLVMKRVPLE